MKLNRVFFKILSAVSILNLAAFLILEFQKKQDTVIFYNTNQLFGLQLPYTFLILVNVITLIFTVILYSMYQTTELHTSHHSAYTRYIRWGLLGIISGGSANIFERLRTGFVQDYWQLGASIFNVADVVIVLGIAAVCMGLIIDTRHQRKILS